MTNEKEEKKEKKIPPLTQEELDSKIEMATQTLDRNISFISSCDNKASIILTAIGVFFTIILTSDGLKKVFYIVNHCINEKSFWSIFYLVLFAGVCITLALGIFYLSTVLIARTTEKNTDDEYNSLIFFSGIKKSCNYTTYMNNFCLMSKEALLYDLIRQIYINADIASIKYANYNLGLKCTITGFILFLLLLIVGIYSF